jgi:hypothetical protein
MCPQSSVYNFTPAPATAGFSDRSAPTAVLQRRHGAISARKRSPARLPFDFTEVLAGLAPRAVFVNAPLHDQPDFEVSGVRDCVAAALPVYRDIFHAAGKLVVEYPDAKHEFPTAQREAAYRFLTTTFA